MWVGVLMLWAVGAAAQEESCTGAAQAAMAGAMRTAVQSAQAACQSLGENQLCYGSGTLRAVPYPDAGALTFDKPGDVVSLGDVQIIQASAAPDAWSLAPMRLQNGESGQDVTLIVSGDVELHNTAPRSAPGTLTVTADQLTSVRGEPSARGTLLGSLAAGQTIPADGRLADNSWLRLALPDGEHAWVFTSAVTPAGDISILPVIDPTTGEADGTTQGSLWQTLTLLTGESDSSCAPASGILIQSADAAQFTVNDAALTLHGAIFLQAGSRLKVSVLDGSATVAVGGLGLEVARGEQTTVPLSSGRAIGAPTAPQSFDPALAQALPLSLLPQAVAITPPATPIPTEILAPTETTAPAETVAPTETAVPAQTIAPPPTGVPTETLAPATRAPQATSATENVGVSKGEIPAGAEGVFNQTFEVQQGDFVTISAHSLGSVDPVLTLIDTTSTEVAENDNFIGENASLQPNDAEIANFIIPTGGTYTVEVRDATQKGGTVRLSVQKGSSFETPAGGSSLFLPVELLIGATRYRYAFGAAAGDTLTISANDMSGTVNPDITLLDRQGNALARGESAPHTSKINSFSVPAAGTYIVEVSDPLVMPRGYFELSITSSGQLNPLDGGVLGTHGGQVTIVPAEMTLDLEPFTYVMDAQAGETLTITVIGDKRAQELGLAAVLNDPGGAVIAQSGDPAPYSAQIAEAKPAVDGSYTLEVTTDTGSGPYPLDLVIEQR
jgi:hypothetical protein